MNILKELNEIENKTIIIVTHDPSMARGNIIRLRDGRIDLDEPYS